MENTMQIVFSLGFGKIKANCETLSQFVSFGRKKILLLLFFLLFFFLVPTDHKMLLEAERSILRRGRALTNRHSKDSLISSLLESPMQPSRV